MANPSIIYDGDLSVPTQDGPGWFTLPFQDAMDSQSWEYHANFTQLASSYIAFTNPRLFASGNIPYVEQMQQISTAKGVGYLVHEDEPSEVNNTGLLRFKRTYAGVPLTRYEGCSVNQTFFGLATGSGNDEVEEAQLTVNGFRKYEYYIGQYPAVLIAPWVGVFFGIKYTKGGWPVANTPGAAYISQDSVIKIYKGAFIERMTLYYVAPTFSPSAPPSS